MKKIIMLVSVVAVLTGCSAPTQLSSAGAQVEFRDGTPASDCRFIAEVTGSQSNWFSGDQPESVSLRHAGNDLRNKAAAMGGNVIYNAAAVNKGRFSDFAPLDSEMVGQVYHCSH